MEEEAENVGRGWGMGLRMTFPLEKMELLLCYGTWPRGSLSERSAASDPIIDVGVPAGLCCWSFRELSIFKGTLSAYVQGFPGGCQHGEGPCVGGLMSLPWPPSPHSSSHAVHVGRPALGRSGLSLLKRGSKCAFHRASVFC